MHDVLICMLPNNDVWFTQKQNTVKKFVKVYILLRDQVQLIPKVGSEEGYDTWPILEYRPYTSTSLCREAHNTVAYTEWYQKMSKERALQIQYPALWVDQTNYTENSLSLNPRGVTPGRNGMIQPTPIHSLTGGDQILEQKIVRMQNEVKRIFKIDLLMALTTQSLGTHEEHAFKAKILIAMKPLMGPISDNCVAAVLNRTHSLCLQYDKEYKKVAAGVEGKYVGGALDKMIEHSEYMAKVGQLVQIAGLAAQVGMPELAQRFDADLLALGAAEALQLNPALKDEDQLQEERKENAQQVQAQQQAELQQAQSESNLNEAQAQKAMAESQGGEE